MFLYCVSLLQKVDVLNLLLYLKKNDPKVLCEKRMPICEQLPCQR